MSNENKLRFVGYPDDLIDNELLNPITIKYVSDAVKKLCREFTEREIIIPEDIISHLLNQNYYNYTPEIGDIYTRFIIPSNVCHDVTKNVVSQTIKTIYNYIKNSLETDQKNKSYEIGVILYGGDANDFGLNQVSKIKIRNRKPMSMFFSMNY